MQKKISAGPEPLGVIPLVKIQNSNSHILQAIPLRIVSYRMAFALKPPNRKFEQVRRLMFRRQKQLKATPRIRRRYVYSQQLSFRPAQFKGRI